MSYKILDLRNGDYLKLRDWNEEHIEIVVSDIVFEERSQARTLINKFVKCEHLSLKTDLPCYFTIVKTDEKINTPKGRSLEVSVHAL